MNVPLPKILDKIQIPQKAYIIKKFLKNLEPMEL